MGAQIAGLFASQGIPCDLLDLPTDADRSRLAREGKDRLGRLKPSAIASPDALELITPGNFADHMPRLAQSDWVIEAVAEELEVKKQLWREAALFVRPDVIASTNTSGITIGSIASALPPQLRPRFLGTHFYNPPRHMRLLEVVPAEDTEPGLPAVIAGFAESVLGKGVVYSRDVPNFIGNRIGAASLLFALPAMKQFGLTPSEIDSVTGLAMGRPRSATFRTLDLIGLDVLVRVCENVGHAGADPWEREIFAVPSYVRAMVDRGWTGEKAGRGFYSRAGSERKQLTALDVDTLEYRTAAGIEARSLTAALQVRDPAERLAFLASGHDVAGRVAWQVISRVMSYAARLVGPVAYDIVSIDRTMKWGFGWEVGPFEAWDFMGVSETVRRMRDDRLEVPDWVLDLSNDGRPFYRSEHNSALQATPDGSYAPVDPL